VSEGWKASSYAEPMLPAVDTYIEVLYGEQANPQVAFINDGRWLGLATYLPHRKLLNALTVFPAGGLAGLGGREAVAEG
jgi:hypothetical protein